MKYLTNNGFVDTQHCKFQLPFATQQGVGNCNRLCQQFLHYVVCQSLVIITTSCCKVGYLKCKADQRNFKHLTQILCWQHFTRALRQHKPYQWTPPPPSSLVAIKSRMGTFWYWLTGKMAIPSHMLFSPSYAHQLLFLQESVCLPGV